MEIDEKKIKKIAKLARIKLNEENIPELLEHLRSGTIAEHLKMNLEE